MCPCGTRKGFGIIGKPPTSCIKCKDENMIDLSHNNCKCLNDVCDTRTSNKLYQGYCLHCFVDKYPDHEISRNYKTKERIINKHLLKFMNDNYPDLEIIMDKRIDSGCSNKMPDFMIECYTHCIIFENDENQHKYYNTSCDNARTMSLFTDLANRPLVMIRFNCDKYEDDEKNKIKGCFMKLKTGLDKEYKNILQKRMDILYDKIKYHIKTIPEKELTIEKLFYDGYLLPK